MNSSFQSTNFSSLLKRNPEHIALYLPSAEVVTVGTIIATAEKIVQVIDKKWPAHFRKSNNICLIASSENPVIFLSSLFIPFLTDYVTIACTSLPPDHSDAYQALVSANGYICASNCGTSQLEVVDFTNNIWKNEHEGNIIVPTSGSTGAPKGVSLSLEGIIINSYIAGVHVDLKAVDSWVVESDLSFMSAISHFFMAWVNEKPFAFLKFADMDEQTFFYINHRAGFGGAPLQLKKLSENLTEKTAPVILVNSGDFLSAPLVDQIYSRFPQTKVHSFYGLTEVSGRFCYLPASMVASKATTTGRPLPGFTAQIYPASETSGNSQEPGEIYVKTPLLFNGYYKEGNLFEHSDKNGWFATGDIGIVDSNGFITLKGRSSDAFKVSGEKVDRLTIETNLSKPLEGFDYCVLPVEHPLIGLCPALFVEKHALLPTPKWSLIIEHLKNVLPSRYIPVYCYELEYLPRLENGKLNKKELSLNHKSYLPLG